MIATKNNSNEKKIVFFFFLTWGFTFFNRLSINFAMPVIQKDLNLLASDAGMVVFAATVAMAISSVIVGNLSDRGGKRKKYLVPAVMIVGIGSAASVFANSFTAFLIIRIIVGIGLGPILGMIFAITESESSENKFGQNTGIIMAGDALIANIIGPVAITQLTNYVSWQMALTITSIPTILIALIIAKTVNEVTPSAQTEQIDVAEKKAKRSPFEIFKYPNIIQCVLLAILTLGAYFSIVTYAPMFLTEISGCSVGTMGIITSLMGVLFIFYAIFIPKSTDHFGRKPVMIAVNLVCALAPLLMFIFPTSKLGIIGYIAFGGVSGAIHVFYNTIIPLESLPEDLKTTGSSIIMALGEILGSAAVPLLLGIFANRHGYGLTMLISGLLFIVAFFVSFTLKESNKSLAK